MALTVFPSALDQLELAVNAHATPTLQKQPDTNSVIPSALDLITLARSRSTDDRQRLLLGVTALCNATPPGTEASPVLSDIFLTLARQAERDIRASLAASLADAEWAPSAVLKLLAQDEIDIARPIIARSPLLLDGDLIQILIETTLEHQIEVARRPHLSGRVADAIIDAGEPATMTALASNRTAEVSPDGMRRLVEQSRRVAALRSPLVRHPRLNTVLANELYSWVGQALRQAIHERFEIDDAKLAVAVHQAVDATAPGLRPGAPALTVVSHDSETMAAARDEAERRLIAKMQAAGQLRAGFLIKAIREGRLSLFEYGMAALSGFSAQQVQRAIRHPTPEPLFLACTAVGIDRAVFPAVLAEIRILTKGWPSGDHAQFLNETPPTPGRAVRDFRAMMGDAPTR